MFAMLVLWGEQMWFEAAGYERRFWVALGAHFLIPGESMSRRKAAGTEICPRSVSVPISEFIASNLSCRDLMSTGSDAFR